MQNLLDKIKKEELIRVIANMHDTIQEWNNGYGLDEHDSKILIKVGDACVKECVEKNEWTLPIL
jgi:hypothetical protein